MRKVELKNPSSKVSTVEKGRLDRYTQKGCILRATMSGRIPFRTLNLSITAT